MSDPTVKQTLESMAQADPAALAQLEAYLAAKLAQTDENLYWKFYEFTTQGAFAHGEYRLSKEGKSAMLILSTADDSQITLDDLGLKDWGEVRHITVNPRIPPEGTVTHIYSVNGVKVSLQFTHTTERLLDAVLEWGAPA
jgi:hypothetical protein